MSAVATVKNGEIVQSTTTSSATSTSSSSSSELDKESFLQLLVAQMKYQDPLEPTSNTEYISQYAQFSQVEALSNMSDSMDLSRASSLVGKEVSIKVEDSSGSTSTVTGKVDYVAYENGNAYLYIDGSKYSLNDVESVIDSDYLDAYEKAYSFATTLNKLPSINSVGESNLDTIDELEKTYNEMTDYEKQFVASDYVKTLNQYIEKAKQLRADKSES